MLNTKPTLFVDMDGVICCFDTGVRAIEPDMIWDDENVNRVCEANPRVFSTLPAIDGAKEALDILKDHFNIYFASTPMWNVTESWMDKHGYIKKNFPWAEKRLILTHNKGLLTGDYIIDDRTVNGIAEFKGEHIHFGTTAFPNWDSVVNYLMKKVNI